MYQCMHDTAESQITLTGTDVAYLGLTECGYTTGLP